MAEQIPSQSKPRSDQPDADRGWTDDGHTIVPTIECEGAGIRVVCPGPDRCKAKYGCERCEASGYIYVDDEEQPCPVCDEDGKNPARFDECWLIDGLSYAGSDAESCRDGEQTDVTAGHEIVWRDQGSYDDPQPEWKSKGVESYDARQVRLRAERLAETEARNVA